jgi:hypothetical protein
MQRACQLANVGKLLNLGVTDRLLRGNAALMRALPPLVPIASEFPTCVKLSSLWSAFLLRAFEVCKFNLLRTEVSMGTRNTAVIGPPVDAAAMLNELAPFVFKTD